jgi:hypothetical protein
MDIVQIVTKWPPVEAPVLAAGEKLGRWLNQEFNTVISVPTAALQQLSADTSRAAEYSIQLQMSHMKTPVV